MLFLIHKLVTASNDECNEFGKTKHNHKVLLGKLHLKKNTKIKNKSIKLTE